MKRKPINIGTSGWYYMHWKGPFYPRNLSRDEFLAYYANHFCSTEINNSFYKLPSEGTVSLWRDAVHDEFVFAVKASRYITHMKKLKDPHRTLPPLLERVKLLGRKLGPILFQLPPGWGIDPERLRSFAASLSKDGLYAFEFRDPSWFDRRTYDILAEHHAAFCIYHSGGFSSPKEVTCDMVYIRLHGPGGPYQGSYDSDFLAHWAGAFSTWVSQGHVIYCYFNNDQAGYAVQDAMRLQSMVAG